MADNFQIKIHDKMYVAFKRDGKNMPHGAMVNYVDNKGNQKKRDALDYWASYGLGGKQPLNSILIDNTPMIGFRMSRSQINAGWAQAPSHIRVEDPRGFEISITINNMIMLTNANVLDNGEIMCECVWGRDNDVNVLLPTNSLPYEEAMSNTERLTTHVHVSKLRLGDHVTLKNGMSGRYLGKLTEMLGDSTTLQSGQRADAYYKREARPYIYSHTLTPGATLHYIEQSIVDKNGVETLRYHGYASPNVSRVEKPDPWTPQEVNERLIVAFHKGALINGKSYKVVLLTLGGAVMQNWALSPIAQTDLEEHIRQNRSRTTAASLLHMFYGRHESMPDTLLGVKVSAWSYSLFNNFPSDAEIMKATVNLENMRLIEESIDSKLPSSEIVFEQLEFELYIESTKQTFKVKI
jgi:hypothetical protein